MWAAINTASLRLNISRLLYQTIINYCTESCALKAVHCNFAMFLINSVSGTCQSRIAH